MAKTFILSILLLSLPTASFALGVSDATTHVYLSEQVKQLTEQLQTMAKQYDELKEQTKFITDTYKEATAAYDRAKGLYEDVQKTKNILYDDYQSVMGKYEKLKGLYEDAQSGNIDDIQSFLDSVYKDVRNLSAEERAQLVDKRYDTIQSAMRKSIEDGEEILSTMPELMGRAAELSKEIGQTVSPKDAQALTNRFLAEILNVLQLQLSLTTKYHQAVGLMHCNGVNEDSIQARQEYLKDLKARQAKLTWADKQMKEMGVSEDMSMKELLQAARKAADPSNPIEIPF